MKAFVAKLRDIAVSGIFALLPLYLIAFVIAKVWKSFSSIGGAVAQAMGMKPILGVGGATVVSGLLIVTVWIVTGLLVRYSFVGAVSRGLERRLSQYIPGYDSYKAMAEEKLQHKVKVLPYTSALIRVQDYWQPGFIVEQDPEGNCVVFLPDTPETNKGQVLLAGHEQLRVMASVIANQLDALLKQKGKGLLSEYAVRGR